MKTYHISLLMGTHFPDLGSYKDSKEKYDQIFRSLSDSFCILSYMSNVCQVRVKERKGDQIEFEYLSIQRKEKVNASLKLIKPQIAGNEVWNFKKKWSQEQGLIEIKKSNQIEKNKSINFNVIDQSDLLGREFQLNVQGIESIRLSPQFHQTQRQLIYFYKQPQPKQFLKHHCFLAFGWGGIEAVGFGKVSDVIKEYFEDEMKIKSIIGSELGGLVGLQIICQPYIVKKKKSFSEKVVETVKSVEEQAMKKMEKDEMPEQQKLGINFIESLNIKNDQLMKFLQENQNKQKLQNSMQKLFWYSHQAFSQISDASLELTLKKKSSYIYSSVEKSQILKNEASKILRQASLKQNITMSELYQKTQVEFTLTALDLSNKIIRFLNHKTTPKLPVISAIEISAISLMTFPRIKWKKQWGKYYVHYDIIRRQIDLSNCEMVSGGDLIPYPINYLDNHEIQSKYFSHAPNNNTYMMGITLNRSHQEYESRERKNEQKIAQSIKQIGHLFSEFLEKSTADEAFNHEDYEYILNKILEIPQTLISAVHNLNLQYFYENSNIILREDEVHYLTSKLDKQTLKKKLEEQFQQIKPKSQNAIEILKTNFKSIEKTIDKMKQDKKNETEILEFMNLLKMIYFPYYFKEKLVKDKIGKKTIQLYITGHPDYQDIEKKINRKQNPENHYQAFDNIRRDNIFWLSQMHQDFDKLKNALKDIKLYLQQEASYQVQQTIKEVHKTQKQQYEQLKSKIMAIFDKGKYDQEKGQLECQCYYYDLSTMIRSVKKLFYCLDYSYEKIQKFIKEVSSIFGEKTKIYRNIMKQQIVIRNFYSEIFLRKNLFLIPSPKTQYQKLDIHVVLESSHQSYKYVIPYLSIIEETLFEHTERQEFTYNKMALNKKSQMNNYSVLVPKITNITASGFNVIPVLLYASKLSSKLVEQKIFQLTESMKATTWVESFQKFEWMMRKKSYQQNQKIALGGIKRILISTLEDTVDEAKQKQQKVKIYNLINKINQKKELMVSELQFLFDRLKEGKNSQPEASHGKSIFNFFKRKKEISEEITENFEIIKNFIQVFGYKPIYETLSSSAYALEYFETLIGEVKKLTNENRKEVGIIKALAGYYMLLTHKIRDYLGDILDLLELDHNITLEQFLKCSKAGLNINFTVFENLEGYLMFINNETRPKIPLWTAILASISLPVFFPAVKDNVHWMNFKNQNRISSFNESKRTFYSGDLLNKMPLELICNNKIQMYNQKSKNKQMIICMNLSKYSKQKSILTKPTAPNNSKKNITELLSAMKKGNSILESILPFFKKLIRPNYRMLKDMYDAQTCQIDAMHPSLIFGSKQKSSPQQIEDIVNFYLEKGKAVMQTHLLNHPPRKVYLAVQVDRKQNKIEIKGPFLNLDQLVKSMFKITKQKPSQRYLQDLGKLLKKVNGESRDYLGGNNFQRYFQNLKPDDEKKKGIQQNKQGKIKYKLITKYGKKQDSYKLIESDEQIIKCQQNFDLQSSYLKIQYEPSLNPESKKIINTIRYFHNIKFIPTLDFDPRNQNKYEFVLPCNSHKSLEQSYQDLVIQNQSISQRILCCSLVKNGFVEECSSQKDKYRTILKFGQIANLQFIQDEKEYSEYVDIQNKLEVKQIQIPDIKQEEPDKDSKYLRKHVSISYRLKSNDNKLEQYSIIHQISVNKQEITKILEKKKYVFFGFPYNVISDQILRFNFNTQDNKTGLQGAVEVRKIFNKNQDRIQSYLVCPKCFVKKEMLKKIKSNQKGQCYFCQQTKPLLLQCPECFKQKDVVRICAQCIYNFKDDDDIVYTCTYCGHDISSGIKAHGDLQIRKCWKCKLIGYDFFYDKKCGYSFCQKCFKCISKNQREV